MNRQKVTSQELALRMIIANLKKMGDKGKEVAKMIQG